jgi:hypothetical protein
MKGLTEFILFAAEQASPIDYGRNAHHGSLDASSQ